MLTDSDFKKMYGYSDNEWSSMDEWQREAHRTTETLTCSFYGLKKEFTLLWQEIKKELKKIFGI